MKKNSDEALVYQNALHNRIYEMSLDQEDDWSLPAGTYEWTIEVKADDKSVKEGLTVSILSGKRILAREKIVQEQEENGIIPELAWY